MIHRPGPTRTTAKPVARAAAKSASGSKPALTSSPSALKRAAGTDEDGWSEF